MADEVWLVNKAKAGDQTAFDVLAEVCRPWLYGLCVRLVHDRSTAEDLVQESLLRAYRDLPQLRDPARFRAWLTRVAVNACRMHLRRRLGLPEEILDGDPVAMQAVDQGENDEPLVDIAQALSDLDQTNCQIVLLFYDEELSHAEIAEVMSLSAAAVKSRLYRAREALRKEMLAMMSAEQKHKLGVGEEKPWELKTVLLVEPDATLRESIRAALVQAKYEVVVLPNGEIVLQAAQQHRGQMLILDEECSAPPWLEVVTLLRGDEWSRENLPVGLLVSKHGENNPEDQRKVILAWHAGVQLILTKPVDMKELVSFVNAIAAKWVQEPETPDTPLPGEQ